MTAIATKPEGWTSDKWATPWPLVRSLEAEFGPFDLDPCAEAETAKAPCWYGVDVDGLTMPWYGRMFVNPPYSNPRPSERLAIMDRVQRLRQRNWLPEPEFDVDVYELAAAVADSALGEQQEAWEALVLELVDRPEPGFSGVGIDWCTAHHGIREYGRPRCDLAARHDARAVVAEPDCVLHPLGYQTKAGS